VTRSLMARAMVRYACEGRSTREPQRVRTLVRRRPRKGIRTSMRGGDARYARCGRRALDPAEPEVLRLRCDTPRFYEALRLRLGAARPPDRSPRSDPLAGCVARDQPRGWPRPARGGRRPRGWPRFLRSSLTPGGGHSAALARRPAGEDRRARCSLRRKPFPGARASGTRARVGRWVARRRPIECRDRTLASFAEPLVGITRCPSLARDTHAATSIGNADDTR
jgi:hypothetical protein